MGLALGVIVGMRRERLVCSFCGRGADEVRCLIAGPAGHCICEECVDGCNELLDEDARRHA